MVEGPLGEVGISTLSVAVTVTGKGVKKGRSISIPGL
jgi:hypothetical protein